MSKHKDELKPSKKSGNKRPRSQREDEAVVAAPNHVEDVAKLEPTTTTAMEDVVKESADNDRDQDDAGSDSDADESKERNSRKPRPSSDKPKVRLPIDDDDDETPALSHKEKRLAKRRKLAGIPEREPAPSPASMVHPSQKAVIDLSGKGTVTTAMGNTPAKSAHGVWVGNMNYATTSKDLIQWFSSRGLTEVTRINMPNGKRAHENNRGFAYVDFPTATDVEIAIGVSEQHLDGRKLLIKSSSDFTGRPTPAPSALTMASIPPSALVDPLTITAKKYPTEDDEDDEDGHDGQGDEENSTKPPVVAVGLTGNQPRPVTGVAQPALNRTARKILDRQKNPPGPTLFLGNLGFETTVEDIREMFDAHQKAMANWAPRDKQEKKKQEKERRTAKKREAADDDDQVSGSEEESSDEEEKDPGDEEKEEKEDGAEGKGEGEDEARKPKRVRAKKFKPEKKEPLDLSKAKDAGIRKVRLGTFEDTGKCKGWAFVDFHLPEQCTRALLNIRNHSLAGRTLTVEYASSDAVRRGAIGTRGAIGGRGRSGPSSRGGSARGGRKEGGRGSGSTGDADGSRPWNDSDTRAAAGDGSWCEQPAAAEYGGPSGRGAFGAGRGGSRGGARGGRGGPGAGAGGSLRGGNEKRAKPGAALASAQRASEAILPSTGRKIVFE
ncbi:BQ2448_3565 [Microbotryum intermedium]|uniref:BQ2448_3565 protein n=1 Tax=Microbotryum intermedium TaxID=269621 RepID=A0A238FFL9_9BASI|nr:BQ2448_3565 [Microbotryum intermedium]